MGKRVTWFRPVTIPQLQAVLAAHPKAKLVVGNTEIGIESTIMGRDYPVRVHLGGISELSNQRVVEPGTECAEFPGALAARGGLVIGGAVTLSAIIAQAQELTAERPAWQTRALRATAQIVRVWR